ncbi:MAG: alpha/beta hydrolase [Bdellovibrionaceae bacterium]|nr:alpha/beta hydrolase [Pseudobdellovibrionaceae bacterium]
MRVHDFSTQVPLIYKSLDNQFVEVKYKGTIGSVLDNSLVVTYFPGGPGLTIKGSKPFTNSIFSFSELYFSWYRVKQYPFFQVDHRGSGASFHLGLDDFYPYFRYEHFLSESFIEDVNLVFKDYKSMLVPSPKPRKLMILGHSFGVRQAYLFSLKHPNLVSHLVLWNGQSSPYFFAADLADGKKENSVTSNETIDIKSSSIEKYSKTTKDGKRIFRKSDTSKSVGYFLNDIYMCKTFLHDKFLNGTPFESNQYIKKYKSNFCVNDDLNSYKAPIKLDLSKIINPVFLISSDLNSSHRNLIEQDIEILKKRVAQTWVIRVETSAKLVGSYHSHLPVNRDVLFDLINLFKKGNLNLSKHVFRGEFGRELQRDSKSKTKITLSVYSNSDTLIDNFEVNFY